MNKDIISIICFAGEITIAFNGEGSKGNELTTSVCKLIQKLLKSPKPDLDNTEVIHIYICMSGYNEYMCINIYIYLHTYIYIYIYIYIHIYIKVTEVTGAGPR
jgi:hypothetical protein